MAKKHILKPGVHQFAPGSAAVHHNDNLTDAEAEWYLQRYPHIVKLFAPRPPEGGVTKKGEKPMRKNRKSTIKEVSKLTPPSGGRGGS